MNQPIIWIEILCALSKALKAFEGGIVIITHSAEFTKDLTEEVWAVLDGRMTPSGLGSKVKVLVQELKEG